MSDGQLAFDFAQIAGTEYDADGILVCTLDHYGEQQSGGEAQVKMPQGTLARPLDPETGPGGVPSHGCAVLWWRDGGQTYALPLDDARLVKLLPKLKKGGWLVHGGDLTTQSYVVIDGLDPAKKNRSGSYTLATPYGGKSHVISCDVRTTGKEAVSVLHGEGMGLVCSAAGKRSAILRNAAGSGYFETNDDGNTINGTTKCNGSLTVGVQPLAMPVVKAPEALLFVTALEAWTASVSVLIAGMLPIVSASPVPPLQAAIATAQTALIAAGVALATTGITQNLKST